MVLRATADLRRAESWALVLEALSIPYRLVAGEGRWAIVVDPGAAPRATAALAAHDREAAEEPAREAAPPDVGASAAGVLVPIGLVAFFFITGPRGGLAHDLWFRPGSAVAEKIVAGEWWRAVTALTLHADLAHVLGNAVALTIFVSALCRWVGRGVALGLVLLSGILGNLATAYLYWSHHDSVGASTAAFGALGLLGGLQFLRRYRAKAHIDRRRRAMMAIAACLGMLAMIGVGERADVVAHAAGLVSGLALGLLAAGRSLRRPPGELLQWSLTALTAAVVAGGWLLALRL